MSAIETLTIQESTVLLDYFKAKPKSYIQARKAIRDRTIVLLMLDAGLRVGEVLSLVPSDLQFNQKARESLVLSAGSTKTKTERTIPLSQRLQDAIGEMIRHWWTTGVVDELGFAFYGYSHIRPLTVRAVEKMVGRTSRDAFGRSIHPHVLRHTFATRLMRTVNIRVVQELLGHKALTSTQVYTHPNSVDLRNAIDGL